MSASAPMTPDERDAWIEAVHCAAVEDYQLWLIEHIADTALGGRRDVSVARSILTAALATLELPLDPDEAVP